MKVVAEIGLAHESSLGMAMAYVDACAKAGVWACKFQDHRGDKVNQFRAGTSFPQDESRADFWKRTAFTNRQWQILRLHCQDRGVKFGVSVFATEAIYQLRMAGVEPDFWKLGSGVSCIPAMYKAIKESSCNEVIASFGMSTFSEIKIAVNVSAACKIKPVLLHCTSEYPCPPEHAGLNVIQELRSLFPDYRIGYSDHAGDLWAAAAAVTLGAELIEAHVVWSKECFGPDVSSSLTIDDLRRLVNGVNWISTAMSHPVDRQSLSVEAHQMRKVFVNG